MSISISNRLISLRWLAAKKKGPAESAVLNNTCRNSEKSSDPSLHTVVEELAVAHERAEVALDGRLRAAHVVHEDHRVGDQVEVHAD